MRRSKLSGELTLKISKLIKEGVPVESACGTCAISADTFYSWMRRGRELSHTVSSEADAKQYPVNPESGVNLYLEFYLSVTKARFEREAYLASKWQDIVTSPSVKKVTETKDVLIAQPDGTKRVVTLTKEVVEESGDGDWRGIAEYLLRRSPDRWGRKEGVELDATLSSRDSMLPLQRLSPQLRRAILKELEGEKVISLPASEFQSSKVALLPIAPTED